MKLVGKREMKKCKRDLVIFMVSEALMMLAGGLWLLQGCVFPAFFCFAGALIGSAGLFFCGQAYQIAKDLDEMEKIMGGFPNDLRSFPHDAYYRNKEDVCPKCGGQVFAGIENIETCKACGYTRMVGHEKDQV